MFINSFLNLSLNLTHKENILNFYKRKNPLTSKFQIVRLENQKLKETYLFIDTFKFIQARGLTSI